MRRNSRILLVTRTAPRLRAWGADLGIQWTNGSSGFLQPGPYAAVDIRGCGAEIGDFQGQQKIIKGRGVALARRAFHDTIAELGQSDGRDARVPGGQDI